MCTLVYAVVPQENFTHCWKYSAPLQSGIWSSRVLWFNKGFVKINAQHGPETSDSFIYLGLNRGRLPARKTGVRICLNLGRKQSTSFKKTKQKNKTGQCIVFQGWTIFNNSTTLKVCLGDVFISVVLDGWDATSENSSYTFQTDLFSFYFLLPC